MKNFCKTNNMNFVTIESYEEDLAVYTAFGGSERKKIAILNHFKTI